MTQGQGQYQGLAARGNPLRQVRPYLFLGHPHRRYHHLLAQINEF